MVKRRLLSGVSALALASASFAGAVVTGIGLSPASATACSVSSQVSGNYTTTYFSNGPACTWEIPYGVTAIDLLVVAGGGGGGGLGNHVSQNFGGGGGGAGEMIEQANNGAAISVTAGETVTVTVGTRGDGGIQGADGTAGGDSVVAFSTTTSANVTAHGGGYGAAGGTTTGNNGGSGGSGGGGGAGGTGNGAGGSSTATAPGHGYAGDAGEVGAAPVWGGGGGGAGGAASGRSGGAGLASVITGTTLAAGGSTNANPQVYPGQGGKGSGYQGGAQSGGHGVVAIRYATPPAPPAPSGDSDGGGGSAAPALVDLGVGGSGAVCTAGLWSEYTGTWATLANDCAAPAGAPAGTTLLGWATTADFPVSIAQRQVTNHWGTYEVFAEDGALSAVFIPAGWPTFVTGANTLYPIWSK